VAFFILILVRLTIDNRQTGKTTIMKLLPFCLLVISFLPISAQDEAALRTKNYNVEKGLALQGYDPVSYFTGKPLKGNKTYAANYKGIIYWFTNAANLETFKKAPQNYEPQYGGWCAYAMGKTGDKVEIDPETFKIISGKLYVFYNKWLNNTLDSWNKNEAVLKQQADANWKKINQPTQ
jgi:YHS domain-containing protein